MVQLAIVKQLGQTIPRTAVQLQAGEALEVTLSDLTQTDGNVSLRWWPKAQPEATHTERVAWVPPSVVFTIPGAATRYMDGDYYWALWWESVRPGGDECLMLASSMFVSTAGGFVEPDPDTEYVTHAELDEELEDYATDAEVAALLVDYVTTTGLASTLTSYATDAEVAAAISAPAVYRDYATTSAPTHVTGRVWSDGTSLNLDTNVPGVVIPLGEENQIPVRNVSGATIPNGRVVYASGGQGQKMLVAQYASGSGQATRFVGMTTHDISNNSDGRITTFGIVRELNTSGLTAGQEIYSTSTPGVWSTTMPPGDVDGCRVGLVMNVHPVDGSVFVCPRPMARMSGTTEQRPAAGDRVGDPYFDTTLQALLVWGGTVWVAV